MTILFKTLWSHRRNMLHVFLPSCKVSHFPFTTSTKGAFVWDQSGIRIIVIMWVSICLGTILIPEYLDFHSGYSAPRSRIAGIGFPFRLFCSQEQNSWNTFRNIFLFRKIPNERALSFLLKGLGCISSAHSPLSACYNAIPTCTYIWATPHWSRGLVCLVQSLTLFLYFTAWKSRDWSSGHCRRGKGRVDSHTMLWWAQNLDMIKINIYVKS